jgi:hypothetical protein
MPMQHVRLTALTLFLLTLLVLLTTVAPSIHTSDSPELTSAAITLGIPHAPGYPLYTLIAHVVTYIPFGDTAFRLNLLSVFATALCAPMLFRLLYKLVEGWLIAVGTTLIVIWSSSIWSNGLVAEVYALQLLVLCSALSALVDLLLAPTVQPKQVIVTGALFGLAVAVHPINVLFAAGFAFAYLWKRIPFRLSLLSALITIVIVVLTLLYLPIRYTANPIVNAAGYYDAQCQYQLANLQSFTGMAWFISGRQFDSLFFAEGLLPTLSQLSIGLRWFWLNFLGVGVAIGGIGLWSMVYKQKNLLLLWLILMLPYTYFFLTYGANDRFAMFSPVYLLWGIPLAYGFQRLSEPRWLRWLAPGFALIILLINYPLVNLRHNTEYHDRILSTLDPIPANAAVFAQWDDAVAMRYFQLTQGLHENLTVYNLFFFNDAPQNVQACVEQHLSERRPVLFVNTIPQPFLDMNQYEFQTIFISERYNPPIYLHLITRDTAP